MANECTNQSVGIMLHAYELQALTEAERGLFETHLLECGSCFQELQTFELQSCLLLRDSRIKQQTSQVASAETKSESLWIRLWHLLWPRVPFVLKPAVIYVVAILSVISTYSVLKRPIAAPVRVVNEKEFFSTEGTPTTRSPDARVFHRHSPVAAIDFAFSCAGSAEPERNYHLIMRFQDSSVVFEDTAFRAVGEKGMGSLSLSPADMKVGSYHVTIFHLLPDSSITDLEYYFRIED